MITLRTYPSQHWHQRAAELRILASKSPRTAESRSLLLQIADEYDLLAEPGQREHRRQVVVAAKVERAHYGAGPECPV